MRKLICNFNPKYKYNNFLQNILNKKLTGFIVTKNLELKNQNPIFGFLIQKAYYELKSLSPYTKSLLHHFQGSERVVSLHKASSFMVLSTQYFIWLHTVFGFKEIPDIYHGMFFQFEHYLRDQIESKLQKRKELKHLIKNETDITIKQTLEIQAELIKLMLNSCYGFTLCNLTSSKFKCF
jgi:DNA polymerase elongation subunit (family B)